MSAGHVPRRTAGVALVTAVVATAGAGVAGCSSGTQTATATAVSWADGYPNVSAMARHADTIVMGAVAGVAATGTETPAGPPYTDFTISVRRWIAGPAPAGTLLVHQPGSHTASALSSLADDPPLHVGEQDVLFLHRYAPGRYYILGGPTGRFPVSNGVAAAMPAGIARDGLPQSSGAFVTRVRAARDAVAGVPTVPRDTASPSGAGPPAPLLQLQAGRLVSNVNLDDGGFVAAPPPPAAEPGVPETDAALALSRGAAGVADRIAVGLALVSIPTSGATRADDSFVHRLAWVATYYFSGYSFGGPAVVTPSPPSTPPQHVVLVVAADRRGELLRYTSYGHDQRGFVSGPRLDFENVVWGARPNQP